MAYRPTERTEARRLEARERILSAAIDLVAQGGYRAASVSAVADGAGVATGSVYRHFPSKAGLFAEVFRRASQREVNAVVAASAGEDNAVERLATAIETFARRALRGRRLAWALLAEPVDPAVEAQRLRFRRAYRDAFASLLADGIAAGVFPEQRVEVAAAALVGAIGEALVGPLSPAGDDVDDDGVIDALIAFCISSVTHEETEHVRHRLAA
ncbi:MAG: TetR/AcrR family transcriptional regulator [Solirubrobacterales bacterium]|jgi:AcrR family transcriptional regulator|nr:TetR/AcrR family transcriptional regulator [Solirubrobacterales bacterium]